ncbi:hypothetical protein QL285_064360 [Trifolium repens]|nr:hypothetical protein QL285_064360 [Trifolium repens]
MPLLLVTTFLNLHFFSCAVHGCYDLKLLEGNKRGLVGVCIYSNAIEFERFTNRENEKNDFTILVSVGSYASFFSS